jgi:hypothetical protein
MSTETRTVKYDFRPGIMRESTEYAAEGGWFDGNRVRFRDGKPESIRGWQRKNASWFIGTGRASHTWAALDGEKYIGFATEHKAYLYTTGKFYDITPYQVSVSQPEATWFTTVTGAFSTESGTSDITVSVDAHGLANRSYVNVCAWAPTSGGVGAGTYPGGITSVQGDYQVSVVNSNSFVITVGETADATSVSKGKAAYAKRLESGTSIAVGGFGYGADTYDAAALTMTAYSSVFNFVSGETTITVSVSYHNRATGSYVHVCAWPGGGLEGITSVSGFYQVSAITSNAFHIVAGSAATGTGSGKGTDIFMNVVPVTADDYRAWNEPASTTAFFVDIREWSMDNFGEDFIINPFPRGGLYIWDETSGAARVATLISGAPVSSNGFLVSPIARQGMCLGTTETTAATFDPMLVRWSSQEDITDWTDSTTNTAGSIRLANGSQIIGGLAGFNLILVWTDTALTGLEFIGEPFVFGSRQLGTNCGLISKHAMAEFDGRVYWMGDSNFFMYSGQVQVLPCTVKRYVFEDFNFTQRRKVYCGVNSEFGEVTWLYCSGSSDECDRYVTYSPSQNYWTYGEGIWTTWQDKSIIDTIITTGASVSAPQTSTDVHYLYDNEPPSTFTAEGQAMPVFIESGEFDIGDGDDIMFIDRIIPDIGVSVGNLQLTIKTKYHPNDTEINKGPFEITGDTKFIRPRARGRSGKVRVSTGAANTRFNVGSLRFDVMQDGKR